MNVGRLVRIVAALVAVALLALPGTVQGRQATPASGDAPTPITWPRDDAPHDVPIEWWYFTGHLFTDAGDRYGFEFVVFKGQQSGVTGYASHFAVTDNALGTFQYDQRLDFAPPGANDGGTGGYDIEVVDWAMSGANGTDRLVASLPGYAIDLTVTSTKPPALHDGDGYIDYGNGEYSYYYSRTRMEVTGTLTLASGVETVTGEAWFDRQWGDFSTYDDGWDWFALQLDDNTELMVYVTRIQTEEGIVEVIDGSLVAADGALTVLEPDQFSVEATGSWTSPRSGGVYPSGWRITVPSASLDITVSPVLLDQELDTRASTGVTYWEGEVTVAGERNGAPISGLGYVELTGYVPITSIGATPEA